MTDPTLPTYPPVIIGVSPPNDGREYDCQCARCGSSIVWEQCGRCGGEGLTDVGELYEQDPLWYDEDDVEPCYECGGDGSYGDCISSRDYCIGHPLPDRDVYSPGTVEWFPVGG